MNLKKLFLNHCKKNNLEINSNQLELVDQLNDFYSLNFNESFFKKIFSKKTTKPGFYLQVDVGVGKTMILNFFYENFKLPKKRVHFNEFMINFHDFVHESKDNNKKNIINEFAKKLKSKAILIYFDEFQVTNIVDAMILGQLFDSIFKESIKIIVTSNTKISNLYKDGLQRDQFKPFIKIMKDKSLEYELIINNDYRKLSNNTKQRFFYPINQETNFKINKFFRTITRDKKQTEKMISIKGRNFKIKNFYEGVARFDFKTLCNQNLGSEDYLEIVKICNFIVIDKVPQFNDINSNQQQRFITLLDVIYDKGIPIAVSADQNLNKFRSSKLLEKPFKRTISRLFQLTSIKYT